MNRTGKSTRQESHSSLPLETELALTLPADRVTDFWKCPPLSTLLESKPSRRRLFSAYYDTPQFDLYRHGVALRVRREGRHWTQTLKTAEAPSGGLHQRIELETRLSRGVPDLDWLKHTALPRMVERAPETDALGIVFTTQVERQIAVVEPVAGSRIEVCVDQGTVAAGHRRDAICEMELELKQGRLGALFELARQLSAVPGVRIQPATKAARGYRLARHERPAPVRAGTTRLVANSTPDKMLQELAFACVDQLQANEQGVLHRRDIEYVHQARVALRRLRSVLGMFSRVIPASPHLAAHRAWLRDIGRTLGAARDWDVFATVFLPVAVNGLGEQRSLPVLWRLVARSRSRARSEAKQAIASAEYTQHMLQLTHMLQAWNRDRARSAEQLDRAQRSARAFAKTLLSRAYRKVIKNGNHLDQASQSDLHQLRISIKKLRYSGELLAPLFAAKASKKFLARLVGLQDVLGELNDAATATRLIDQLASMNDDPAYLQILCYLRGYAAARSHFSSGAFAAAWKPFIAAEPYW